MLRGNSVAAVEKPGTRHEGTSNGRRDDAVFALPCPSTRAENAGSRSIVADEDDLLRDNEDVDGYGDKNPGSARRSAGRLSEPVRFGLVVILSFASSFLAHALLNVLIEHGVLATFARRPESSGEHAILAGWKVLELAVDWFGGYDGYDLAAMSLLSHGPVLSLLSTFYLVSPLWAAASLTIKVVSSFVPFFLLRPLSAAHSAAPAVHNHDVITDKSLQVLTVAYGGLIYHVVLYMAYKTFFPDTLVLRFNGIPSIEAAADANLYGNWTTAVLSILFGLAVQNFVFVPAAWESRKTEDAEMAKFNGDDATVGDRILWRMWGRLTKPTKVALTRTALVTLLTGMNTYLQCAMTIVGIEPGGAAIYAGIWAIAGIMSGLAMGSVAVV